MSFGVLSTAPAPPPFFGLQATAFPLGRTPGPIEPGRRRKTSLGGPTLALGDALRGLLVQERGLAGRSATRHRAEHHDVVAHLTDGDLKPITHANLPAGLHALASDLHPTTLDHLGGEPARPEEPGHPQPPVDPHALGCRLHGGHDRVLCRRQGPWAPCARRVWQARTSMSNGSTAPFADDSSVRGCLGGLHRRDRLGGTWRRDRGGGSSTPPMSLAAPGGLYP